MRASRVLGVPLVLGMLVALLVVAPAPRPAEAAVLPTGFQETPVVTGLVNPTVVRFAANDKVFLAEKSGLIRVLDGLEDTTLSTYADLRTQVHNFWDRGLLGMALAPNYPTDPSIYVLYTYDFDPNVPGTVPRWGTAGGTSDGCPTPPGPTDDGCVVTGRLSRLTPGAGGAITETPLIADWCQQYPSHSIGALNFGADGYLYVSGGDGASFNFTDYGQDGDPPNPCGDPPGGRGVALGGPSAEGGALRSQDVRTSGDPLSLDGTILRIDPATGAGAPGNPLAGSSDVNARRVIGHGLRNPFRFTIRPGTNEVWLGDVGWGTFEEINRLTDPGGVAPDNFGWPCYEGTGRQSGYDGANVNICENLYTETRAGYTPVTPYIPYRHGQQLAGETCATNAGSSTAGVAFYPGGTYPTTYNNALFFADYSRDCIWVARAGANGLPDPATVAPFVQGAANPVNLEAGPGGDLFYPDFDGGRIVRIAYAPGNRPPVAAIAANPTEGPAPLTVNFNGSGSTDPDASDVLTYAWDLNGDGVYTDATGPTASRTFTTPGSAVVRLRVTDPFGATDTEAVTIAVGNTSPTATITTPTASTTWKVGDTIGFSGSATDPQQGTLPPSALSWQVIINHCEAGGGCHQHPVQTFSGVASGTFVAPDHEYPSTLELRLTATDSGGLTNTKTVVIQPQTVNLSFASSPSGLRLAVNGAEGVTPFTRTVITGSNNTVSAVTPQTAGGTTYQFTSWSDGGAQTHNLIANAATTLSATYRAAPTTWVPHQRINFQPAGAPVPSGYVADTGAVYGDRGSGRTFGWSQVNSAQTRDRNSTQSADQRYDTLTHLQKPANPNARWEIAVPNGQYRVRLVCGDASHFDSVFRVAVEGSLACNATPTSASRWTQGIVTVTVTDGRLTITNAAGGSNNKINFVDIDRPQ